MSDAFDSVLDELVERYGVTNDNTLGLAICRSMARLLVSDAMTASDAAAVNSLAALLPNPAGPQGLDLTLLSDTQLAALEDICETAGIPEKSDDEDTADLEQQVVDARAETLRIIADKKISDSLRETAEQSERMNARLLDSALARCSELEAECHDLRAAAATVVPAAVPQIAPPKPHNVVDLSPFNHGR